MGDADVWTRRFATIAGINALIAVGWLAPLFVDPRISRTIAGGSVGTWGVLGFLLWIGVGVLGFVGFAVLHHITPRVTDQPLSDNLSWVTLVLTEIGALFATVLLGVAGYIGGTALLQGANPGQVHEQIAFVVEPVPLVAIFAIIAGLGVVAGVANHLRAYFAAADEGTGSSVVPGQ